MANVILLEDDADLRELYASALRLHGHTVYEGASSRRILPLLQETAADILITDLMMPGHEGMEGIFLARQKPGLRIIAMSSNQDFLQLASGLVDACLHKPFSATDLLHQIQKLGATQN